MSNAGTLVKHISVLFDLCVHFASACPARTSMWQGCTRDQVARTGAEVGRWNNILLAMSGITVAPTLVCITLVLFQVLVHTGTVNITYYRLGQP